MRAAWRRVGLHSPWSELVQAGETLQWFHELRGWFREGTTLFAQAVEQVRAALAAVDSAAGRQTLGCLLGNYGYLATRLGAGAEAQRALEESYALLADGTNLLALGRTLNHQAALARWSANYDEARRLLDRSRELTVATGDRVVRAMSLTTSSIVANIVGDYDEAEQLFRLALGEWRVVGNPRGTIWCITSCSATLLKQGKHQEAERLLRESLSLSYATDDRFGTVMTLHYLGLAALEQGDAEAAVYFLREALPVLQRARNWEYLQVLNDLGAALWQAGARNESRRTFNEALSLATEAHAHHEILRAVVGIAAHALDDRAYATALKLATHILADESTSDQARQRAIELRQAACAHLSPDEVARIESACGAQSLAASLAELGLPARIA